jgi:hypothetical protein
MPETEALTAPDLQASKTGNDWAVDSIREAITAYPVSLVAAKILSGQLQGCAAERPLKNSELSTLARTLIATLEESPPEEPAL